MEMEDIYVNRPPDSDLKYRVIRLDNGLSALLIRDETCKGETGSKAAASLAVRVGSFHDPPDVQGLSHFLEHMIFAGTEKFPGENDFLTFLSEHGGKSNGDTSMEHTTFHFHVQPDFLKSALHRFSQCFTAPLLKAEPMKREISIIDEEFQLFKQDDCNRLELLRAYTSKKGHVFNRFPSGNKKSLNRKDLCERVRGLYNDCYRGGAMSLCVIGGDKLSVLEKWVKKFFGTVKKGPPKTIPPFNPRDTIWDTSISYGMKAAGDKHILELSWILPPLDENFYFQRPEQYLVEVLAQQGKGSLSAFFKDQGWANSLVVKESFDGWYCTSIGRLFIISMDLTLSGLEKRYQLISYIYEYFKLIQDKKPQKWVMEDFWKIKRMEYRDLEVDLDQPEFAKLLSGNMLRYPLKHVISADYSSQWKPKAILDLLKCFTPERMRIDFASKSVKENDLKNEPWCDSLYMEEEIPPDHKKTWSNTTQVHASLFFPSENRFIATDFHVRELTHVDVQPECFLQTPKIKLWHQREEAALSYAYFRIYLKDGYSCVKNNVMADLFTELLKDGLNEIIDQSDTAKLYTSISLREDQLFLEVFGYREKLSLLLSEIWNNFMDFSPTAKRFEIIKENVMKNLKNMAPPERSDYLMHQILHEKYYGICMKLKVLKEISFPDLQRFIASMRSQIFIEGLCYGNMLRTEAEEIADIFRQSTHQVEPLPENLRHKISIVPLRVKLRRRHCKVSDSTSLIKLYFQIGREKGKTMRKKAMVDLFHGIIKEMLFNKLRQEEQLAYTVDSTPHLLSGFNGFSISVISAKHDPVYLLKRVCRFVNLLGDLLEKVSDKTFEDYKSGVISGLDNGIDATWKAIVSESYDFDFYSEEVAEIERIQKKDLIKWYRRYFRVSSPSCCRLALCLWGCDTEMKKSGPSLKRLKRLVVAGLAASHKIFRVKKRFQIL